MPTEKSIALATLGIGEGNPLSIQAAQRNLAQAGLSSHALTIRNPLTGLADWRQGKVTGDEEKRTAYNNNYEATRNGWPAKILGLLSLLQLSQFVHQTKATRLILAQELPLSALASLELPIVGAIIRNLEEITILVPDVFSKPGAVTTVQKLQKKQIKVQLAVWNTLAQEKAAEAGINAQLIAPWLMPALPPARKNQAPMSVVRPSGTGINENYLPAIADLAKKLNPHNLGQQIFSSRGLEQRNRAGKQTAFHPNHFSSLTDLLTKMFLFNPEVIFSYPSEMMQIIVQFYLAGWKGQHLSLPARGLHEIDNAKIAKNLGLTNTLGFDGKSLQIQGQQIQPNIEQIASVVGKKNLASLLATN